MFDAAQYFKNVNDVLWTSRERITLLGSGINVYPSWDQWSVITWSEEIEFDTGNRLDVRELYKRGIDGSVSCNLNYHFMRPDRKCIFRFDTHGMEVPLGQPCHVHIGEEEEVFEEGHGTLRGYSLENINFLQAYHLAYRYINGDVLPWS